MLRLVRKVIPSTTEYDGQKLFTGSNGKRLATPLFAVLIMVETTDVVFAVDSIPAILAVTREQFIVFSSNAFAILGLRALYFLLADLRDKFRYLNVGLGVILAFVGVKMLLTFSVSSSSGQRPLPHAHLAVAGRDRAGPDGDDPRVAAGDQEGPADLAGRHPRLAGRLTRARSSSGAA